MNLPLHLLSAAACLIPASARSAPAQPTLGSCTELISNHLNAALGRTDAILRLSDNYRRGINLFPRNSRMALYYHLQAIRHGHTLDAALTSRLINFAISDSYLESCPSTVRQSPDGNIRVSMQHRYPDTPGIVHITIETKTDDPAPHGSYFPLYTLSFPADPSVEFHDDFLTLSSPGHRLEFPYNTPLALGEEEDTYRNDLLARSDNGDTIAMTILANLSPDKEEQIDWMQKAADLGDTEAMFMLGLLYGEVYPEERDLDKARQALTRAAEAGHPYAAEYLRGLEQQNSPEQDSAAPPSRPAPNPAPNPPSFKQDNWRKIAGHNINGISNLGIAKFIDNGKTLYALGLIWDTSLDTIDTEQTFIYADIGELSADLAKWRLAFQIQPEETAVAELPPGVRLIPLTWQEHRALTLAGTPAAYLKQIFLQEWAHIDPTNPDFLAILRKTAEREGTTLSSICNLARPEASACLNATKILADTGNPEAMYQLGQYYLSGHATSIDPLFMPGIAWFEQAAKLNHPGACAALGLLHAEGLGVKKDIPAARRYLQRARGIPAAERLLQTLPPEPEK